MIEQGRLDINAVPEKWRQSVIDILYPQDIDNADEA